MADPAVRLRKAAERLRKADAAANEARQALYRMMREEFTSGRMTKSGIARAIGVSRQRVQRMLEDQLHRNER